MSRIKSAFFALLSCSASLLAAEWNVAPGGNDAASGAQGAPFRTIARALSAAQPGDTVLLHNGTYREAITPSHDGLPDSPITVAAAPGARPVISALEPVAGPWTPGENGIFSAAAPAAPSLAKPAPGVAPAASTGLDQIFINGVAQPEARFPNHSGPDPLQRKGLTVSVGTDLTIKANALAQLPANALASARFHGIISPSWTAQSGVVASNSGTVAHLVAKTLSSPWWPSPSKPSPDADAPPDSVVKAGRATGTGYFYGNLPLLDAEGEWIIERSAAGDTVRLRPPGGRDPGSLNVERKVRPWTIDLNSRSHWIVRGLHLVGGAARLKGSDLALESCELVDPAHFLSFPNGYAHNGGLPHGSAIVLEGRNSVVRNCLVRDSAGSGIQIAGTDHLVSRNQILNTDCSGTYAAGISVGGRQHLVEFNTICDSGRDCVILSGSGHRVIYNIFQRPGRLTLDGGGFYTYGQNGAEPGTGRPTEIAYNWAFESGNPDDTKSRGIYLDNYSRGFIIHHNVVRDIGRPGKNKGMHAGAPALDIAFYHNTLIGVLPPTGSTYDKFPASNSNPNFWTAEKNELTYTYQNNLCVPHGVAPETVFENPAAGDYRPRAGTDAIDPATVQNVIAWSTHDGKTGVPSGYALYMQDKSVPFRYSETFGRGVRLPGINDHTSGSSPDDGAYERGRPCWRPGHDGHAAGSPAPR